MLARHRQRNLVWIDLTRPTPAEVKALMQEFNLDPLIAEELLVPSFKPKVERRGDAIYVILHFPAPRVDGTRPQQEIDFVIGKHFLITAHYETVEPLHAFAKAFEVSAVLGTAHATHGGHLFAAMARDLYQSLSAECDALHRKLEAIEDRIFSGNERQMVVDISQAGRTVHDFRQSLLPHREMLNSLEPAAVRFFDQAYSYWVREVIGAFEHVEQTLAHLRDSLQELRTTNDSLLNTKQNEIMKVLTIMAFVTFPLTLISSIFGMNTHYLPIVGIPGDFWIVLGMMLILAICFFIYFKRKGWL